MQRGRVHRPDAVVELHEPLQSQTVVSLGLETKDYSSLKWQLAQDEGNLSKISAESSQNYKATGEEKNLSQVHYQKSRFGHLLDGIAQAFPP